jgi:stalled ribosome rescue protein Dom34
MNKRVGIWIDTKQAVIIFLKKKSENIKIVKSSIEARDRVPGEKKLFSRFGVQFSNFETKKENRKMHEVQNYLEKVVEEIKDAEEVVLFGPAEMKINLEKFMHKSSLQLPVIRRVETTDNMTKNQKVAWARKFFNKEEI